MAAERPSRNERFRRLARPLLLLPLFAALFAVAVVPRITTWGSTAAERRSVWPGDDLSDASLTWTNAVTIEAPADHVWPWVTQLGQGRAGLYSYDWLENLLYAGVHSKNRIMPEHQQPLAVGDEVLRMTRYSPYNPVALYEPGRALVLGDVDDTTAALRAGRASSTWAFIVEPLGDDRSRLIARTRVSALDARLQGPVQFVMQRKLLQGIKERAEGIWQPSATDVIEPLTWFAAFVVLVAGAWRATRPRPDWWRPLSLAAVAGVVLGYLLFWQPPIVLGVVLATLLGSTLYTVLVVPPLPFTIPTRWTRRGPTAGASPA